MHPKARFERMIRYEYWPFWLFYLPAYCYYPILAMRAKTPLYFTVLNPIMRYGGTFLYSKYDTLQHLPKRWIPKTLRIDRDQDFEYLLKQIHKQNIDFPLIAKPDKAERGKDVEKISGEKELKNYLQNARFKSLLLQEFIDYPLEIGVLFYWDTQGQPQISSLGYKSFCKIIGDGKKTFGQLVLKNVRIAHRAKTLKKRFKQQWNLILPIGKEILVEPIGNHNRGTQFFDGSEYYNDALLDWTANCLKNLPGFDYGRLDIKITDWEAFQKNQGIKILEINGVNAEPIHIYDQRYNLIKAYKELFKHMKIIYELSLHKIKNSQSPLPMRSFKKGCYQFFIQKNNTP